jgi:hypothetical protein
MRIAPQVVLTSEQRARLETYARGRRTPARVVLRARIVLLTAEGNIAGLEHDAPRPGRTPSISPELVRMVIAKTTQERPSHATHWSTRSMAAVAGISEASVRRIWHGHGLEAAPRGNLQAEQGSPFRRETGGHRRPVSESARACARAVIGREEPDPRS